mgnify:CR=1 FL=1
MYFTIPEDKLNEILEKNDTKNKMQKSSSKNLEKFMIKMNAICSQREKIMSRHVGKMTWVDDIIPNFDHNFWKSMGDHKLKAIKLWGLA